MRLNIRSLVFAAAAVMPGCVLESGEEWEDPEALGELEQPVEGGSVQMSGNGAVRIAIDGENGACSGVIIGRDTIITAAHCANQGGTGNRSINLRVDYYDAGEWFCLSEATTTRGNCTTSRGARVWVNPDYNGGASDREKNDFAVIVMNNNLSYVRQAHRMRIMEEPSKSKIGSYFAIGYGRTFDGDTVSPRRPSLASFNVDTVASNYYSSTATSQRLCRGDSGSPQYENTGTGRYVFGLHARRGDPNGDCGETGTQQLGTIVAQYMSRIETRMGRTCTHTVHSTYGKVADCW